MSSETSQGGRPMSGGHVTSGDDEPKPRSYGEILKSSALIGGSTAVVMVIGVFRTKIMAMLLGPTGFGLMGLYGAIADLAVALAGAGLNASGVRQIAEAAASGDNRRISRTATVLRWTSALLGLLGAAVLLLGARQISALTFGRDDYSAAVGLLSLAVLFRLVAAGQGALIQGMRRIADLGRLSIAGALLGTLLSVPLVYLLRDEGVALSLVCVAAASVATSWWYSRKVAIEPHEMTVAEARGEAAALLRLGMAFMASGVLMMVAAYLVRAIVLQQLGLEAAGLYSAAWTLSGMYIGIILQAMGSDFYPRLVGVASNDGECNRLVNEQTQVGMLLAIPGIIATLAFAPIVVRLFYTAEFTGAVELLRWMCLGMALRVISWPIGYIVVAKNHQLTMVGIELAWTVCNVGLCWLLVGRLGVNGTGIAFFLSYVFHSVLVLAIAWRISGFSWSSENLRTGALSIACVAIAFVGVSVLPLIEQIAFGAIVVGIAGYVSIVRLLALAEGRIPARLARIVAWLRRARAAA